MYLEWKALDRKKTEKFRSIELAKLNLIDFLYFKKIKDNELNSSLYWPRK